MASWQRQSCKTHVSTSGPVCIYCSITWWSQNHTSFNKYLLNIFNGQNHFPLCLYHTQEPTALKLYSFFSSNQLIIFTEVEMIDFSTHTGPNTYYAHEKYSFGDLTYEISYSKTKEINPKFLANLHQGANGENISLKGTISRYLWNIQFTSINTLRRPYAKNMTSEKATKCWLRDVCKNLKENSPTAAWQYFKHHSVFY